MMYISSILSVDLENLNTALKQEKRLTTLQTSFFKKSNQKVKLGRRPVPDRPLF